jgi:hypothetical protein
MNTFNKARLVKKKLNDKLRKKYIDLGNKFLINLMVPITAFTGHLCVLQGGKSRLYRTSANSCRAYSKPSD